jgi:hypothetical protein
LTRIALDILCAPHAPAARIGYVLNATRLVAHVSFKNAGGWTPYRQGVVDTGAAASLLPAEVWHDAQYELIGSTRVGGINARDECRIPAQLALVDCALSDGNDVIGPLAIHAYLAESNEVPLLLGVCDLLETGVLSIAIRQGHGTFEA